MRNQRAIAAAPVSHRAVRAWAVVKRRAAVSSVPADVAGVTGSASGSVTGVTGVAGVVTGSAP